MELTLAQIGAYFNGLKECCDTHECNGCKHSGYCAKLASITVQISDEDYKFLIFTA